ncbi:MAG: Glycosyl transferase family 2 [candidate division WWE3 bacterium GW2011_GWF2_41_45]|uniref:Glycosyl transferase n=3 Tax=Katanobacteria TaxID=422282 RepID=A0A1F4W3K6_UNCKA|nr:MAG: Glycosyl transferase family 2 [candidate division WWE3 bacterium GW2011_GWC2_41_23]KKS10782.1 MAG: Glycosyl transferase family 2 [candidate division WWE3 bacterium GW2011_GWF2_41_45]KKS12458.1 MAG: Glycosyl transferase family 2 [candidate division WWE3 bacterium GW2011_GWF1_41_53]KKS20163.1 MAG: Glycosyl transferase family 2 [candidate division WWE3 bacterium GW2011_GWE1_41_72]KKS28400.1 MAG: Glycosyl transferase family 2 [candidate division WWE3 bacterium GW2011_GWC1_42_102]KKS28719.1
MKLSIVVPVYNEKNTIEKILNEIKAVQGLDKEIIVVDDASTDGTIDILKGLELIHPDVHFYYKEKNRGKGHALKVGFEHTIGDYVIVQDADLEYDPNDYLKLIRALDEHKAQVIYGSRFSGSYEDMSTLHYFGNKILTLITNIFFGVMLTDMETCYKLMPGDFVRNVNIKSERFDFEPEITAKILKSGLKIREVPISYRGRTHNEGKKITWRDGIHALFTLIKYRFMD